MLKQTLLVAGLLTFATAASALEVTNPFYTPDQNSVASVTSYEFSTRTEKGEGWREKTYRNAISEALSYGITDSVAVTASGSFNKSKFKDDETTKDTTEDFELGAKWNVLSGKTKVQANAAYGQKEGISEKGAYKYAAAGVKAGHTFGVYTPYVAGNVEVPVAQSRAESEDPTALIYKAKVGLYTYCPKQRWAIDTGVTLTYDENYEARVYTYDLEASYFLTKNVTLGVFGSYDFAGQAEEHSKIYGNSLGLRLRAAF